MTAPALSQLKFIAVEGPIGVGKTTLTRRLADHLGARPLLEAPERNPFLEDFYKDAARWALPTQLAFLMDRVREFENLLQADLFAPQTVADFMFEKDDIFARLNLTDEEYRLYRQVACQVTGHVPHPDLVIYLQAPVAALKTRVSERKRRYEQMVSASYLERLSRAYAEFFHHYSAAPLLIINTDQIDFAHRDADFAFLVERLSAGVRGRCFLNLATIDDLAHLGARH